MLDLKFVRENTDKVIQAIKNRQSKMDLDEFKQLDQERRDLLQEVEADKSQRNTVSAQISKMKKNGEDATEKILAMRALGDKISEGDKKLKDVESRLHAIMLTIPNMPAADVPVGKDDSENPEVRKWGELPKYDFEPKNHWEIGENLGILDAERAAKVSVPGSITIWVPVPIWNVRSTTSCWTSIPRRTAIRK